ncbi:3,4-dihydroxy-2-butanone-4-phosphate synthase [Roseovarius pacificus]|uniref:3,4-dihydroxy-2-butanone-4-phosphate synthase n=1 Tax=Roseovarius pacificus TaxID=337701 RepID=UPI002A187778|nr:3,4-dihydroxy-2-butanone-4-phosphate synthase [Roseovarius pacificus]
MSNDTDNRASMAGSEAVDSRMPANASADRVRESLAAIKAGEMVIVTDDNERENEGDLVMAACFCRPEQMAFMLRHTSGIVCTPMPASEAKRFELGQMVTDNDAPHSTAFTVSVDFRHGTTTGISAEDRTLAVRNLANANTGASDFVRPGHVFPLVAKEGGVLIRSGHTEAAVDLCVMSGLPPVGVICELVNDDGSVMHDEQISLFAEQHGLKVVSVSDLIRYRQESEVLVQKVDTLDIDTVAGPATAHFFKVPWEPTQHLAIVYGDLGDGEDILVRVHRENVLTDVFEKQDFLTRLSNKMVEEGRGVIIYLREGASGVGQDGRARDFAGDEERHAQALVRQDAWREVGLGAQILRELGVSSMRLVTSSQKKYVGVSGFGIRILGNVMV